MASMPSSPKIYHITHVNNFPWQLIEKIGTFNNTIVPSIQNVLTNIKHQPMISVERNWYF